MRPVAWLAGVLLFPVQALASHPLITEDTGVLDTGQRQLEAHGGRSRDAGARASEVSAVLGYGFIENAELQLELPYSREKTGGGVMEGRGDASVSVKWLFYERDGLRLVLKPGVFLPTGRDELGLGAGRTRWAVNFVAGRELGRLELIGHVGYLDNRNVIGERRSLTHASAALVFAATDRLKLLLDVSRDTNPDPDSHTAIREIVYGLTYALSDDIDLGLGIKKGLSDPADDRSLLLGVKLRF